MLSVMFYKTEKLLFSDLCNFFIFRLWEFFFNFDIHILIFLTMFSLPFIMNKKNHRSTIFVRVDSIEWYQDCVQ